MTEDEMVGWHHQFDGHEFGWTPGVGDGEAWDAAVHGVTKSWTQLNLSELNSTLLAWRIPMDRGAWPAPVNGIVESDKTEQLTLSFHFQFGGWLFQQGS